MRCLSRLIEPTAGEVVFDGRDLLACAAQELIDIRRHKMGMVFQHFALLPHLTVLDNVAFPLEVQGVDRAEARGARVEMIELVGLGGREIDFPRELSGGQQQRVGIARSLAVEPELWFLDEPFSALDPLIRREMQDEFLRLQRLLHKTIVFITHDFDEAIRLADRIAIMKDGEIVQIGTPEDLVLRPGRRLRRRVHPRRGARQGAVGAARSMRAGAGRRRASPARSARDSAIAEFARRLSRGGRPLAVRRPAPAGCVGQVDARRRHRRVLAEASMTAAAIDAATAPRAARLPARGIWARGAGRARRAVARGAARRPGSAIPSDRWILPLPAGSRDAMNWLVDDLPASASSPSRT